MFVLGAAGAGRHGAARGNRFARKPYIIELEVKKYEHIRIGVCVYVCAVYTQVEKKKTNRI